ncbi:MAG TPA: class I SAM-dependent methyltransferase [Trinickia sp.]
MHADCASKTAEYVARHRAAHQVLDAPTILDDPFALIVTDSGFVRALQADPAGGNRLLAPGRRAFLAARCRYAEDLLARAVRQGCGQYVVLGAGFDTFCLRSRDRALRVFEIDHPATQAVKLARLHDAGIGIPDRTSFHAADFTRKSLTEILSEAGVDREQRIFVSWLGVAQYLPRETILDALADISAFSTHVEIVFDYTLHYDLQSDEQRSVFDIFRRMAELAAEPFLSMFTPDEIVHLCGAAGFSEVKTTSVEELNALYCPRGMSGARVEGINQMAYACARTGGKVT